MIYMSNFKEKKIKVKNTSSKNIKDSYTLDKKHKENINLFNKNTKKKINLEQKINKIKDELKELNNVTDVKLLEKKTKLLNLLDNYELNLINIKKITDIDYYDKAGDILESYYEDLASDNNESKSILEFLTNKTTTENNGKTQLFEKYCNMVDGIKISKETSSNRIINCNNCKIEKIYDISNSSYTCTECGDMELIILDDDNKIKEYSCYKRLSHFKEWLLQFQAKEVTNIDNSIYNNIVEELKKNRIDDTSKITRNKLQKILFKLGYSYLYEHIPFIINKLSNIPPPKISQDIEKQFYKMFIMIQEPWEIYKPKNRKNIISYSYIIYKFCELLELDNLLKYFPLLKSSKKIQEHDMIWKKFCKHLKWEFYPTNI